MQHITRGNVLNMMTNSELGRRKGDSAESIGPTVVRREIISEFTLRCVRRHLKSFGGNSHHSRYVYVPIGTGLQPNISSVLINVANDSIEPSNEAQCTLMFTMY
jgi:hypothetical protein